MNNKCRLCKSSVEDVNHVISSCPKMSATLDIITYVLKAVIMKNHPDMKYRESTEYESVNISKKSKRKTTYMVR